jgi:hypothetical protein
MNRKRRAAMLTPLRTGAGASPYAAWLPVSETLSRSKSELYLKLLYNWLRDITVLREGGSAIRNFDLRSEIAGLLRRNIQKAIALDGLLMELRGAR